MLQGIQKLIGRNAVEKAIEETKRALEQAPEDPQLLLKLGNLYAKAERNKDAIQCHNRLAQLFVESGLLKRALAVYKQMLQLKPESINIKLQIADLSIRLGRKGDGMAIFEEMILRCMGRGDINKAWSLFHRARLNEPSYITPFFELSETSFEELTPEEILFESKKLLRDLAAKGQWSDFFKVGEHTISILPEMHELLIEVSEMYLEQGMPKKAAQKLQLAFQKNPKDLNTLELLVDCFAQMKLNAKCVSVLWELIGLYQEQGRFGKLRKTYQQILLYSPDDQRARAALDELVTHRDHFPTQYSLDDVEVIDDSGFSLLDDMTVSYDDTPAMEDMSVTFDGGPVLDTQPETFAKIETPKASSYPTTAPRGHHRTPPPKSQVPASVDVDEVLAKVRLYIKYGLFENANQAMAQIYAYAFDTRVYRELSIELLEAQGKQREAAERLLSWASVAKSSSEAFEYLEAIFGMEDVPAALAEEASVLLQRWRGNNAYS